LISEEEKEARRVEYREAVRGLRLIQPFGSLYGELVLVLEGVKCPDCGKQEWLCWEFELRPDYYRFLKEKG